MWHALQLNPVIFRYMMGRTLETFEEVVENIYREVTLPRHWPRTLQTDRRRRCILDVLHVLAFVFDISKSTVAEEIYHVLIVYKL